MNFLGKQMEFAKIGKEPRYRVIWKQKRCLTPGGRRLCNLPKNFSFVHSEFTAER